MEHGVRTGVGRRNWNTFEVEMRSTAKSGDQKRGKVFECESSFKPNKAKETYPSFHRENSHPRETKPSFGNSPFRKR